MAKKTVSKKATARKKEVDASQEKVKTRAKEIPTAQRSVYTRAMTGKSKVAGIKAFCNECMGWDRHEVAMCTCVTCPLYPYRPNYKVKTDGTVEDTNENDD